MITVIAAVGLLVLIVVLSTALASAETADRETDARDTLPLWVLLRLR